MAHALRKLRETGRWDAFRLDWTPGCGRQPPHVYWDSDVAKWIESAAYAAVAARHDPLPGDGALATALDEIVRLVCHAQQPDGYLNTHFTVVEPNARFTNLRDDHELYCAGHLFEAAVAHADATGESKLLEVACRYADLIVATFGTGAGQVPGYPGHEEIELALVRLYRATGRKEYLDQAAYFVDQRGRLPDYFEVEARARGEPPRGLGDQLFDPATGNPPVPPVGSPPHYQNHLPVREQDEAVGHAVRALYLYCGVVDVARETGDEELWAVAGRLWRDVTGRKAYVTGGVGSSAKNEGFTFAYDLPNETAYAETCAAVALVLFAHRLLQVQPDGDVADWMERALYNGVLSGSSLDGRSFFYRNPLAVPPSGEGGRAVLRSEWFGCACCPNNLTRLLLSLGKCAYSEGCGESAGVLAVHLFVAGSVEFDDRTGRRVVLDVETGYPRDGRVAFHVRGGADGGEDQPTVPFEFALLLRWPGWAGTGPAGGLPAGSLLVNGEEPKPAPALVRGYARLERRWLPGDVAEISIPMVPRRVYAHPRVVQDAGRVALARGPLVYCLEEADVGPGLDSVVLPPDATLSEKHEPGLLGGVVTLEATGSRLPAPLRSEDAPLYRNASGPFEPVPLKFVPYYSWANRGPGEMRVWLRER
ncbi:MAG: glycoside hydrolase family 127 protein [Promethearchaeota archaeon]